MTHNIELYNKIIKNGYVIYEYAMIIKEFELDIIINLSQKDLNELEQIVIQKNLQIYDYFHRYNNCIVIELLKSSVDMNNYQWIKIHNIRIETWTNNNLIKLNNLSKELKKLKISSAYPFDIPNLPIDLVELDLSDSMCKFNLDFYRKI